MYKRTDINNYLGLLGGGSVQMTNLMGKRDTMNAQITNVNGHET